LLPDSSGRSDGSGVIPEHWPNRATSNPLPARQPR
jgi:hypothetical protein